MHQPGRFGGSAANQVGVPQQKGQVRICETRNVAGRVGELFCRADEFVDTPGQSAGAAVHGAEPEPHMGRLKRCRRAPQRLLGHACEVIDLPQRPHRHDQRKRRHHRVKTQQTSESKAARAFSAASRQRADTASRQACTAKRSSACAGVSGIRGKAFKDRRRLFRLAEHPHQIGRPYGRPVVASGSVAIGHFAQRRLGLIAASQQDQVHCPHPGRPGCPGLRGGCGEPVGKIQIQQRHGMPC